MRGGTCGEGMEAAAAEGRLEDVKALLAKGHPADPVPPPQQTFEEELQDFAAVRYPFAPFLPGPATPWRA